MKLNGFKIFLLLMTFLMSSIFTENIQGQTPYTNSGKSKYVKTTVDTFSIPGVTGAYRQGFITNQSASIALTVYFSKRDGSKDTSSKVSIPAGKTLHFNFVGTKIFRNSASDSVFSQVIIGDVQLNYNGQDNMIYEYAFRQDRIYNYAWYSPYKEFIRPKGIKNHST